MFRQSPQATPKGGRQQDVTSTPDPATPCTSGASWVHTPRNPGPPSAGQAYTPEPWLTWSYASRNPSAASGGGSALKDDKKRDSPVYPDESAMPRAESETTPLVSHKTSVTTSLVGTPSQPTSREQNRQHKGGGPKGGLLPSSSSKGFSSLVKASPGKASTVATSRAARKLTLVTKLVALSALTSLGLILCLVLLYLFPPSFTDAPQAQQRTPQALPLNATHDQLLLEALEQAKVAPEAIAALGLDVPAGGSKGAREPQAGAPRKQPEVGRGEGGDRGQKRSGGDKERRAEGRKRDAEGRASEKRKGKGSDNKDRQGKGSDKKDRRDARDGRSRSRGKDEKRKGRNETREGGKGKGESSGGRRKGEQSSGDRKEAGTKGRSKGEQSVGDKKEGAAGTKGRGKGEGEGRRRKGSGRQQVEGFLGALASSLLGRKKSSNKRFLTTAPGCPRLEAPEEQEHPRKHYPNPRHYDRKECRCTPVHNFVVLSMQRSGSGWFETFLNSHPNVSSFGEIFGKSRGIRANLTHILETLDQVYNLEWNNSAAKNSCTVATGFKWMLNQGAMAHHEAIAQYFLRNQVSVIMLVRRNVLRRLISILANAYDRKKRVLGGQHKSHVHSHEEAKRLAEYKPHIGVNHLMGNLQRVQQIVDDAVQAFNATRMKIISYEEVVRSPKVLAELQKFLGVPVVRLHSKQVKIHTRPLNESIENYDEVAKKLQGTPLEFVLSPDYN